MKHCTQCISLQYISRRTGWVVWSRVSKARTCSRCPLTMHARCKRDPSKKKMQYFWLSSSTRHHNVGFQPLLQGRTSEEMQFLGRGRIFKYYFSTMLYYIKGSTHLKSWLSLVYKVLLTGPMFDLPPAPFAAPSTSSLCAPVPSFHPGNISDTVRMYSVIASPVDMPARSFHASLFRIQTHDVRKSQLESSSTM